MALSYLKDILLFPQREALHRAQVVTSLGALIGGIMFLLPGNTAATAPYRLMSQYGNDLFWGCLFLAVSLLQMGRILTGKPYRRGYDILIAILYPAIWVFTTVCVLIGTYPPLFPALAGEVVLTLVSLWVFLHHLDI